MKKIFTLAFAAVLVLSALQVSAQSLKFGHINFQELVQAMPDLDTAKRKFEAYQKDLEDIYKELVSEYQRKQKDFDDKQATWSESVKAIKQRDLNDILRRMQEQSQSMQQEMQLENQKLMEPVIVKAQEAMNKVGKTHGLIYIFDTSSSVIVYFNETQSVDVMPLVKKELNIK
jgi:outer membrane protein